MNNLTIYFLNSNFIPSPPSFEEIVKYYGPYLGLIIALLITILTLQYYWFRKLLTSKEDEIKRLIERDETQHLRILHLMDNEIGYKKAKNKL